LNVAIQGEDDDDDDAEVNTPLKLALQLCDMELVQCLIQKATPPANVNLGAPLVDVVLALTSIDTITDQVFYDFLQAAPSPSPPCPPPAGLACRKRSPSWWRRGPM
jgi:hypothetical protein